MSRYRISIEFDLDIEDDEQARLLAADTMHRIMQQHDGTFVSSRGESPEVAVHGMAQKDRPVATSVAVRLLATGAAAYPWVKISNFEVDHVDDADS